MATAFGGLATPLGTYLLVSRNSQPSIYLQDLTYLQWHAADETSIPPQLLCFLTQPLKIPHLTNHDTPSAQQPLVQRTAALHFSLPLFTFPEATGLVVVAY